MNRALFCPWRLCVLAALVAVGCQQDMGHQPYYKPLEGVKTSDNPSSARVLEEGTVARGYLRGDPLLYDGIQQKNGKQDHAALAFIASVPDWQQQLAGQIATENLATEFPFPITEDRLKHGRESYNVYCAVCHDRVGTGRGMIVQRGYLRPPSYHTPRLREAPVGHFFAVITRGKGGMPDYAEQIPPVQRWEIIAYIRALQLSQNSRLDDLSPEERLRLESEGKP
jgi:mono/diheme cytochrome c family protein